MNRYEKVKRKYKPHKIRLLFIAESPPSDISRYFYFEKLSDKDALFRNLMDVIFFKTHKTKYKNCLESKNKTKLLKLFQQKGYYLIDACDKSISGTSAEKTKLIIQNYPRLLKNLESLITKDTKIVLISSTVFKALYPRLKQTRFNVIHDNQIPFPLYQWRTVFQDKMRRVLS